MAESRPSVLRGDHLFAVLSSETHQEDAVTYKGFVHRVELDRVKLSFSARWVLEELYGGKVYRCPRGQGRRVFLPRVRWTLGTGCGDPEMPQQLPLLEDGLEVWEGE